jgi:endoglucanase
MAAGGVLVLAGTALGQGVTCGLPGFPACEQPAPPAPAPKQAPPVPNSSLPRGLDEYSGPDRRGVDPRSPNPLVGEKWFVDHKQPSWRYWRAYRRRGLKGRAATMRKIAREPKFRWFGRFNRSARREVREYIDRARRVGEVPLIATLRHQGRECNSGYQAGGPREDARTRSWFRAFARGIGRSRVIIAFEPDSVGTIKCLARSRRKSRYRLLKYGIDVLSKLPNATIYIEATASDWVPAARVARALRRIGVRKVRGFMLNTTHYDWTSRNIRYGLAVSRRVGGKPFVISTHFNGRGPVHYRKRRGKRNLRINVHCHPRHRGVGIPPGTSTAHPKVDAYFWVGRPGYSGGSCNGGPLPVGTWWPARALALARNGTSQLGPKPGTRFGWPRGKFSLRDVAGDQLRR